MRIVYKVFAKITGGVAAKVGQRLFKSLWARIDEHDPPKPESLNASFAKVVLGATLEAATMAAVGTVVERATASTFQHLFGVSVEPKKKETKD